MLFDGEPRGGCLFWLCGRCSCLWRCCRHRRRCGLCGGRRCRACGHRCRRRFRRGILSVSRRFDRFGRAGTGRCRSAMVRVSKGRGRRWKLDTSWCFWLLWSCVFGLDIPRSIRVLCCAERCGAGFRLQRGERRLNLGLLIWLIRGTWHRLAVLTQGLGDVGCLPLGVA